MKNTGSSFLGQLDKIHDMFCYEPVFRGSKGRDAHYSHVLPDFGPQKSGGGRAFITYFVNLDRFLSVRTRTVAP